MLVNLLNHIQIRSYIEPTNQALLSSLEIFDTIDSTNSYLLQQAKIGRPSGSVCLAEQQTQGRGRLGRVWFSPYGKNIYCSLLWRFSTGWAEKSSLSIAVAVMIAHALQKYGLPVEPQLKWPNDVLIAGRKLAGILLESNDPNTLVIGVGLNVDVAAAKEKNWIDLTEILTTPVQRNRLTGILLNELLSGLQVYNQQGFLPFRMQWQRYDVLVNRIITLHTPTQQIIGTMRGLSEQGELLLQTQEGILQRFSYGEISVRLE